MIRIDMRGKHAHRLRSRIFNWKFHQALQYLPGQPEDVKKLVKALASRYENTGWLSDPTDDAELAEAGMTKEEAVMVSALVDMLLG
jgi:hypothetical protein